MKKFIFVILIFFMQGLHTISFANEIVWQDTGRGNTQLSTILCDPDSLGTIYIGTNNGIFKTEDGTETWRNILLIKGQNRTVNLLLSDPQDKTSLYAATGNGLYYSDNRGNSWMRIFQGEDSLERQCSALAVLPEAIYLGTKGGLFVSKDKGRLWHKETGKIGKSHILAIAYNLKEPNYPECGDSGSVSSGSRSNTSQNSGIRDIYVACTNGVFKSENSGQSWKRIFTASPIEDGSDIEEKSEEQDEEGQFSNIRYLSVDPNNLNYLYLATTQGVYQSHTQGLTWQLLPDSGLFGKEVKFILVGPNGRLFSVTKSGIFEYRHYHWQELSLGLVAEEVRFLAIDNQDNLYAATDKGLFKTNIRYLENNKPEGIITLYSKDEPGIQKVQQAAIRYAEVEPGKIKLWREQARKKAVLPQLSIGIDRNTTDLWHWEGGSTTKTDDDILRRGRDSIDWDITLSWDLSELIWNDDQTSIDVRSRLMVQLRDDILDEVTKLYFERIRVKMELDNLSIEDRKKRFEKELRLQELTAQLDGLTGGYFSSQIKGKF